MNYLETRIEINASPEKVWQVLTDFKNYPNWNPFIKSIEGEMKLGQKFKARIEPPDAQGMSFTPVLLAFEPNKEFRWKGKLLIIGLFDGEHQFKLIRNNDNSTTLIQSEKFTGILVPLFSKMINTNTRKGFELMNGKIKELAEK
jgi:hypothetical protein